MKIEKKIESIDAFLTDMIEKFGEEDHYTHTKSLYVFDVCSEYGAMLHDSTIDALVLESNDYGNIRFVYNMNERIPEFDWIDYFDLDELYDFAQCLANYIENDREVSLDFYFKDTDEDSVGYDVVTTFDGKVKTTHFDTKEGMLDYLSLITPTDCDIVILGQKKESKND